MCCPQAAETMQKVFSPNSTLLCLFQFLNLSQETQDPTPASVLMLGRCNWLDSNAVRELAVAIKEPRDVQCLGHLPRGAYPQRGSFDRENDDDDDDDDALRVPFFQTNLGECWDGQDNPESSIEHLRFSHQKQMGQFFGRLGMGRMRDLVFSWSHSKGDAGQSCGGWCWNPLQ